MQRMWWHGARRCLEGRVTGLAASVLAALVVAFPTSGGAATAAEIDVQGQIVLESWEPGNLPNDPNRCITVHFLEFPAVAGAGAYTAVVLNHVLNANQTFIAGPTFFPGDSYTVSVGGTNTHTFTAPGGSHRIVLGSDSSGQGCTTTPRFTLVSLTTTVVNPPPVPSFTWQASASDPLTIEVDASGSTDDESIASYAWSFGDGGSGSGQTTSHTFAAGGTYSVALTVTDNEGATDTETIDVTVAGNEPPTASFSWRAADDDPFTIEFDGSASSDDSGIESYEWDFGDGQSGSGTTPPPHTYDAAGTYSVTLTVTDADNASDSDTQDVDVAVCPSQGVAALVRTGGAGLLASSPPRCPLVVNVNSDEGDPDVTDGRCDVDADQGGDQCTLRAAIQEANGAGRPGFDEIIFDIPGTPEIVVSESLPALVGPATIDGFSQDGVTVDAAGGEGLVLEGTEASVRKLAVVNASVGFRLAGAGGNTLDGVLSGLRWNGTVQANTLGVRVASDGNTLKGVVASGNTQVGLLVEGANNTLDGVIAGLTSDATALAPNGFGGLIVRGNANAVHGGVFTGNRAGQIAVEGEANQLEDVIAGLSGDGSTVVPGQTRTIFGIGIVGGARNVVAGAKVHGQQFGVLLAGGRGHSVERSRVTGASIAGIAISQSAVNKVADNVVADANGGLAGILVTVASEGSPPPPDPQPTEDNLVQSNVIGGEGVGNPVGVLVNGAARTVITGNWIAGNDGPGVTILDRDGLPTGTVVTSNAIGLQFTGTYAPNQGPGVFVSGGHATTIGGTGALDANLIATNSGPGVLVQPPATVTSILGNEIFGNFDVGIDDNAADAAFAPDLLLVTATRVDVRVRGASGSTQRVELFANDDCDPSGAGEGKTFLAAANVTIGANGVGLASIAVPASLAEGALVTATSTGDGSTSEFSTCTGIAAAGSLTAAASAGATRLELDSTTGLVGKVVAIGAGPTLEKNYGDRTGSLILARPTRFAHATGEVVVALPDTLFVSVDKAVVTRSSKLPDLAVLSGRLRAVQGRSVACGEDVTLSLGGSTVAQKVPGTRFSRQSGNRCVFVAKTENGIGRLELDLGKGTWNAQVIRRDLERLTNPVEVALRIGDDAGSELLPFRGNGAIWTYVR
jgi:PKD repeat protein